MEESKRKRQTTESSEVPMGAFIIVTLVYYNNIFSPKLDGCRMSQTRACRCVYGKRPYSAEDSFLRETSAIALRRLA